MQTLGWLHTLKEEMRHFLFSLKGRQVGGYYRYSLSDESTFWGLANTVFATKILYMLDALSPQQTDEMSKFICSFQQENGIISAPYIHQTAKIAR